MSRKVLQIEISPRAEALLYKELNRRQLESHYAKRMKIICYSATGKTNKEVSQIIGCMEKTVRRWRKRWKLNQGILKGFEKGHGKTKVKDKELMDKIKEILSDSQRQGAPPPRITELEIARLQTLACELPEKYGLPFTNWTHVELAKQAKQMDIIVSPAHFGRF